MYARYAEMTVELRQREGERRTRRGCLNRTIHGLRAQLLQHLDAHDCVRQLLPDGRLMKRMVSTTYRSVTNDALRQALQQALQQAPGEEAALVRAFKTELLRQLRVTHVYADVVESGGRQDRTACYAGECGADEMSMLSPLDPGHPMCTVTQGLQAALASVVVDDTLKVLQQEHRELGVMVTQQLRTEGTQVLRVGDRRGSLRFRQVHKKPKLSASLCSTQFAAALASCASLDPEVVGAALFQAIGDHVRARTVVVESAGLKLHRT